MHGLITNEASLLRWLTERIPGVCVIQTDARGVFTHFGPGAEAFFACPASEAIGKLKYDAFHDAKEMEACRGSEEFRAAMVNPGWTEDIWSVVPRVGGAFRARVTLLPLRALDSMSCGGQNEVSGWLALYRRLPE